MADIFSLWEGAGPLVTSTTNQFKIGNYKCVLRMLFIVREYCSFLGDGPPYYVYTHDKLNCPFMYHHIYALGFGLAHSIVSNWKITFEHLDSVGNKEMLSVV